MRAPCALRRSPGCGCVVSGPQRLRQPLGADFFDEEPWFRIKGINTVQEGDESTLLGVVTWRSESVNSTLECKEPGCEATTNIVAFNTTTHLARNCRLYLDVHPTDFDDQYSGERLEWVRVNGVTVNHDCFPMVSGCNASTQRPTFPCLSGVPLDGALMQESNGVFNVSAKIADVVDECPFNGNLLAAVPRVACHVARRPNRTAKLAMRVGRLPAPPSETRPDAVEELRQPTSISQSVSIRCLERNCTANAHLAPNELGMFELDGTPTEKSLLVPGRYNFSSCSLNLRVFQTDFDQADGSTEIIEFVKVGNTTVATDVKPGGNPCRARWRGESLAAIEANATYSVLKDEDVTKEIHASQDLALAVQAKISAWVDECSHEGYLLDGEVDLNCTVSGLVEELASRNATNAPASNASNASSDVVANATNATNATRKPLRFRSVARRFPDAMPMFSSEILA
eukprot:TRINITY_DN5209_c0_g2_i2.p1 TRINITY_DN5209_c0_g2~~TRINITY_DN5209_c0_g2_i2.p1  ORF type:complete len:457 (+),score=65.38 TRINITY_DN5209_c0_g2_i2:119-1489(+)